MSYFRSASQYSLISVTQAEQTLRERVKERMAFIIKKKRYKFQVDLTLNELTEVSFGKATLFAKVRQLEGGNFQQSSKREEVENHAVKYDTKFTFPCKMAANSSTGVLDSCKCRVSIRKEEKGGKNFRKIGFVDVDLAEYAGAGPSTQRYILQAYDLNHRLDNSLLQITLNITLREGDLVFQRPLTRNQPILLPGEEAATGPGGGVDEADPSSALLAPQPGQGTASSLNRTQRTPLCCPTSQVRMLNTQETPAVSVRRVRQDQQDTLVSQVRQLTPGRTVRTPARTGILVESPLTRASSAPWRRTRGGRSWTRGEWMLKTLSMS